MFTLSTLWATPDVNPINRKARSIPVLNPITNVYGRVFHFSWFGFFVAFWSWYAFPPLLTITIAKDLQLSKTDVANSNIVALLATLIVRLVAGPACDWIGPRYTFAAVLLAGSIPTALAGTVTSASGLIALRFFVGILGGSFVPCQVWSTGFFDKNVVGTANALTGGWGNAGGGITYFLMPAIFDSLISNAHLTPHVAWRVAFIVPFIIIVTTAISMILLCPDTPTGKWSERHLHTRENLIAQDVAPARVDSSKEQINHSPVGSATPDEEKAGFGFKDSKIDAKPAIQSSDQKMVDIATGEVIQKPFTREALSVVFSLQTLALVACYFCSFGAELAINSSLGTYYLANFPSYGQTGTGRWAAMFGLLNIVTRPIGGVISDILYRYTGSVWAKKIWIHALGITTGIFLIAIGVTNSHSPSTMFGLVAGMAIFLEAGNGANFSLVPHVHPFANGIVSGCTGAAGNLGGIIFAIIFRYLGTNYAKAFWVIGIMHIGINLSVSWIRPVPRGQIGGK